MEIKDESTNYQSFDDLMKIIRQLRGEGGCPWDQEQTHESLKNCMIEEAYETIEAIDNKDYKNLCEELGDVLLQIALHTAIAEEEKEFTFEEIIQGECKKMIYRHPHVFGNIQVKDTETVLKNWDEIKLKEKNQKKISESILSIPKALPANIRAEKVQKKASKAGLDFEDYEKVLEKVYEELEELKNAKENGTAKEVNEEFGDLMFSVVNLSRFLQLNAENSLTNATNKFINRFVGVEHLAEQEGRHLWDMSIGELDALWGRVK
jgi:tetrapyrrole methylase family protein/MazG family protein